VVGQGYGYERVQGGRGEWGIIKVEQAMAVAGGRCVLPMATVYTTFITFLSLP